MIKLILRIIKWFIASSLLLSLYHWNYTGFTRDDSGHYGGIPLGDGYMYYPEKKVIYGTIITGFNVVNYDSNFIIASEASSYNLKPTQRVLRYPAGMDSTYYWICNKKTFAIYGPMTDSKFKHTCNALNVGISFDR